MLRTHVEGRAFEESHRVRHSWEGAERLLLALLVEPGPASEVMAQLGETHGRLAEQLASFKIEGRRPRFKASQYITMILHAH